MYCSNNCCKCKNHLSQIDNLFYSIIQCCIKASLYTIPQKGHTDKKCSITPGWTDSIQPLKNKDKYLQTCNINIQLICVL